MQENWEQPTSMALTKVEQLTSPPPGPGVSYTPSRKHAKGFTTFSHSRSMVPPPSQVGTAWLTVVL